jgi:hypothetical protein
LKVLPASEKFQNASQKIFCSSAAFFLSFLDVNEKGAVAAGSVATCQSPPHM